ncbi:DNA polymerase III subunit gamma and tau [Nocardia stercoris]|uniref:DNA polymerase III subunit gamma and tau n=1 Tax=Nocardia stercoris TaxID=2483361 RepID=UPI001F3855EF|nr:DNA polymerase III subunit gamma and tau [Nocardia stercoris]
MALYRKYRPATFAEVVGQEHVTDPLSTALDTGRISHAYLFSGPRGCGKTSSARILARSLNCVEGPTSRPCGVCPSCIALAPGGPGNLDVIELDAASHGGVDDTRELRDRAFYAPAESRYRVFIVDEAHMVTTAGFNALLKIVEEPPAHLIFIFATTEPDKVLATIRSRTHHYPFRLLPPATMRGLLGRICDQEGVRVEEAVYPLVIRAGGGSPRDSLSVLDQLLAGAGADGVTYSRAVTLLGVTDIALIDEAVEALAAADGAALFGAIDRVVEAGHDPRRFATDLLERLRDLILLRAVPDAAERNLVTGPGDVLDRMRDQATRIGPATLTRCAELLHEGLGEMRGATAPRLLLEVICARMLLPSASDAEAATLQRLERLEQGLASGVAPAPPSRPQPRSEAPSSAAPAPAGGEPRHRGAEALAALREQRSGGAAAAQQPAPAAGHTAARSDASAPAPAANAEVPQAGPDADATQADVSGAAGASSVQSGSANTVAPQVAASAGAPQDRPASTDAARDGVASSGAPQSAGESTAREPQPSTPASNVGAPVSPSTAPGPWERGTARGDAAGPDNVTAGSPAGGAAGAAASGPVGAVPQSDSSPTAAPAAASRSAGPEVSGAVDDSAVSSERAAVAESEAAETGRPPAGTDPSPGNPPDAGSGAAAEVPSEAAASGAGGAAAGVGAADVEARWADIRAEVRKYGAAVQALLSGAAVLRVDSGTVVFAHPHAALAQRLSTPQYVEALRSAIRDVLGAELEVRWEVGTGNPPGGAGGAGGAAARSGRAPARPGSSDTAAPGPQGGQPSSGWGAADGAVRADSGAEPGRGPAGQAPRRAEPPRFTRPSQSRGSAAPDDDIPPPDYPDQPDDPGPSDYSPVGYDRLPPAPTPEEEREMMADAATPAPSNGRLDPDEVALELLRSELGATSLEG